jgi:hypothetical protein
MTSPSEIQTSQRKAASIAGFALLLAIVIVVAANYSVSFRLIVPGDAEATARNILANQTLFRVNVACDLVYLVTVGTLLSALYVILQPVNRAVALAAAVCRLVFALMLALAALNMLGAMRLLGDAVYLPVFRADQLHTLAMLHLASSSDDYYVGLPFWGLASTLCSWLLFKSRYVPRPLAAYGVIASAWCVICAFAFIIYPRFDKLVGASWFDMPLVIFEIALGFWLLFRSIPLSKLSLFSQAGT